MKKFLKWTGIAILLLVIVPILLVAAYNAFDETLDPKAVATGEVKTSVVPEAENGFFALVALSAGDGTDGPAYARAWIAEARAAVKENRDAKAIVVKRAKRPDLCDPALAPCLAAVQDPAANMTAKLEAYKEDLERYEKLIAFRAFDDVLDYGLNRNASLPGFGNVASAQRAWLVRAALAVQDGKFEDALSAVERDLAFQRAMLSGASTLIGKLVAASNYRRDLAFLADLLQTRAAELKPFAPRLTEALKPLPRAVLSLDAGMDSEFAITKQILKNPDLLASDVTPNQIAARIATLFYKPNATINKAYRGHIERTELMRRPPSEQIRDEQHQADNAPDLTLWNYIDNPFGNWVLTISNQSYVQYAQRMHDLDAYHRLVGLGFEMASAGVETEGVADYLAKSDARFHDPYTKKPMDWDAAKRQLSMKGSKDLLTRKQFGIDKGRLTLQI